MTHKIGTFELLFQKAGKRSLLFYDGYSIPKDENRFIELPNIVYCYSYCYNALFVVGTDKHITSINDILNNQDEKVYGFNLPNAIFNSIGTGTVVGTCLSQAGFFNCVDDAASYFLNSWFSSRPCFTLYELRVSYSNDKIVKLSTFSEFFDFLKG